MYLTRWSSAMTSKDLRKWHKSIRPTTGNLNQEREIRNIIVKKDAGGIGLYLVEIEWNTKVHR
jgi:hypothetical protein